jgi:hypothetical protein
MSYHEIQARDKEVRGQAYRQGFEDALDGLPEDPEPATMLEAHEGAYRYMLVWNAYIEGRVDAGADLPF